MKIQIITEREIDSSDYWEWARATLHSINIINRAEFGKDRMSISAFTDLLENKEMSFEDDLGYTKVKTTYKIL